MLLSLISLQGNKSAFRTIFRAEPLQRRHTLMLFELLQVGQMHTGGKVSSPY